LIVRNRSEFGVYHAIPQPQTADVSITSPESTRLIEREVANEVELGQ